MLRDGNCDKNFERTLLAEISRAKIAARKMHNNRKTVTKTHARSVTSIVP